MASSLTISNRIMKRLFDICCSLFLLLLFGWVILVIYLIATIEFKANGFFKQRRTGKNGEPFNIYKIRSMREVAGNNSNTTTKNDPRLTKFGNFIRKLKLDETPQFLNVFKGDMSLVGPRPTVREDYDKMDDRQKERFNVRPGITGLAQINGNDSLYWPERIEYDLIYIKNYSFWSDLKILFTTFSLIVRNEAFTYPVSGDEWNKPTYQ